MSELANTHALERTSPKGTPFVGRCILCGKTGLSWMDAKQRCENPDAWSDENVIVAVVKGGEG